MNSNNNMEVKRIRKYVVATMDNPTMYLHSLRWGNYELTDNIEYATKSMSRSIAEDIKQNFYLSYPYTDLVVIPLIVSYGLINESANYEIT